MWKTDAILGTVRNCEGDENDTSAARLVFLCCCLSKMLLLLFFLLAFRIDLKLNCAAVFRIFINKWKYYSPLWQIHSIAFWVYWIIYDLVQTLHFYAAYSISSYTITFLMHFFKIMNESLLSGRSLFTHSKWEWRRRNVRFQYRKLCFLFCYLHVVWQVICVMQTINFDGITILLYLLVYLYCTGDKNRICYAKAHTLSKTRKEGNWTESRREIRLVVAVMLHKIQCNVHKSNTTYDFDVRIIIIEWKCFHCIRIEHDR